MKKGISITREEANVILEEHMHLPRQQVTICWQGEWYDIRELDEDERWEFISYLTVEPVTKKDSVTIEIN